MGIFYRKNQPLNDINYAELILIRIIGGGKVSKTDFKKLSNLELRQI